MLLLSPPLSARLAPGMRPPTIPRNAAQCEARALWRMTSRYVAEREDADEALVAVHHRHPANLLLGHVLSDVLDLLIFEDVLHLGRHHIPHPRLPRVPPLSGYADRDIAIGD